MYGRPLMIVVTTFAVSADIRQRVSVNNDQVREFAGVDRAQIVSGAQYSCGIESGHFQNLERPQACFRRAIGVLPAVRAHTASSAPRCR